MIFQYCDEGSGEPVKKRADSQEPSLPAQRDLDSYRIV